MSSMLTFGEILRRERKQTLQLSQEKLGEKLGVTQQTVANWETGKAAPEPEHLAALRDHFGPDSPLAVATPTPVQRPLPIGPGPMLMAVPSWRNTSTEPTPQPTHPASTPQQTRQASPPRKASALDSLLASLEDE
jgi:DNA-binding XRE family transcriptional regulator